MNKSLTGRELIFESIVDTTGSSYMEFIVSLVNIHIPCLNILFNSTTLTYIQRIIGVVS